MHGGDDMRGIDLNGEITYKTSSLRFFEKNECHVTRTCPHDVLLLVYEGVLRFSEDGEEYELHPGDYFIQRSGLDQAGEKPSDSPKYLYIHFIGEWVEGEREGVLARSGNFDCAALLPLIYKIDRLAHGNYTYTERMGVFFEILSMLYRSAPDDDSAAGKILKYIDKNYLEIDSLENICEHFHYSKNHIINIFRQSQEMTPFEYINDLKIRRAMYLLEVTSKSIEEIAIESGFNHYSHFYRLFMRKNGISPFEWRKKVRLNARLMEDK
jgi:AraC-like DNA-binding protein